MSYEYKSRTATARLEHGKLLDFDQTLTTLSPGKDWELDNHISADDTNIINAIKRPTAIIEYPLIPHQNPPEPTRTQQHQVLMHTRTQLYIFLNPWYFKYTDQTTNIFTQTIGTLKGLKRPQSLTGLHIRGLNVILC